MLRGIVCTLQVTAPTVMGLYGLVRVYVVSATVTLVSPVLAFTVIPPAVTAVSPNIINARGQVCVCV